MLAATTKHKISAFFNLTDVRLLEDAIYLIELLAHI